MGSGLHLTDPRLTFRASHTRVLGGPPAEEAVLLFGGPSIHERKVGSDGLQGQVSARVAVESGATLGRKENAVKPRCRHLHPWK